MFECATCHWSESYHGHGSNISFARAIIQRRRLCDEGSIHSMGSQCLCLPRCSLFHVPEAHLRQLQRLLRKTFLFGLCH